MKYIISISILLLLMTNCKNYKEDVYSKSFNDYLSFLFNKKIPKDSSKYIIIPKDIGCSGCRNSTINHINTCINAMNLFVICSDEASKYIIRKNNLNVLIDSFGEIEKYNLQTQNTVIINTFNGKIIGIYPLTPENIDSMLSKTLK